MQQKIKKTLSILSKMFPEARCELSYSTHLELLIAVMLSAQTTDKSVNTVTPLLFKRYKTAKDYVNAPLKKLEQCIRSIGLYKTKAKNIQSTAKILQEKHKGMVPKTRKELEALPGVGRKTANVVLSVAFHQPVLAVDTHIARIAKRLGFNSNNDSVITIENTLTALIPKKSLYTAHHLLIFFGRYHCTARNPHCKNCPFSKSICTVTQTTKDTHK